VGLDVPGARAAAADAELELGRYDEAAAAYERLGRERPDDPAVLLRRARLAFLRGETDEAASLADRGYERANEAGVFGAALAQYDVLRSTLAFDRGDYEAARRLAADALDVQPGWHVALAASARATAAVGDLDAAAAAWRSAVEAVPEPGHLAGLAAVLTALGDDAGAREQLATIDVVARLGATHRQVAMAWVDAGIRADEALVLTTRDLANRGDVYGHDAQAWALLAAGRPAEARAESERALALGTRDARLLYHAGMISAALGDHGRAASELRRALAISPAFDPVQAPRAAAALRMIEAAS
jgi:tetratricopeptide (TPR) repeat protein